MKFILSINNLDISSNVTKQKFSSKNISCVRKKISNMMDVDFVKMGQYAFYTRERDGVVEYYNDTKNEIYYIITVDSKSN